MKNAIFLLLLLAVNSLLAQTPNDAQDTVPETTLWGVTEFKANYIGNILWNHGLVLGGEMLFQEKLKTKQKKKGPKTITKQWLLNGNLAFSLNPFTETDAGFFTQNGLIFRRTNPKGKQLSLTFNPLGYYRSFLPETYEVSGERVRRVRFPGRSYYAPSVAIGIGKLRKGKKLSGRYLNLHMMWRTPYNAGTLPTISLEYGYRFKIKKKK